MKTQSECRRIVYGLLRIREGLTDWEKIFILNMDSWRGDFQPIQAAKIEGLWIAVCLRKVKNRCETCKSRYTIRPCLFGCCDELPPQECVDFSHWQFDTELLGHLDLLNLDKVD